MSDATLGPPAGAPIRVVIVEDDRLVRVGLAAIVDSEDGMMVVGEAADGNEALRVVAQADPDVVLMDVRMPGLDGIAATAALTARAGTDRPKVLVVTTFEYDDYVYEAFKAGASGFLLKRAHPDELVEAVRMVTLGESLVFPALTRRLVERHATVRLPAGDPRPALLASLTEREGEILRAIAAGLSNAEIAERLYLSLHTVKTHVGNVLVKIGARDRTQAVVFAYETGFITPGG